MNTKMAFEAKRMCEGLKFALENILVDEQEREEAIKLLKYWEEEYKYWTTY